MTKHKNMTLNKNMTQNKINMRNVNPGMANVDNSNERQESDCQINDQDSR